MVYVCSAHNIEWLPQTRDSLPTASDLLFLVESKLPRLGWDETKIAELLGIAAKETDLPDMHNKFLAFREKLAGKTLASGPGLDKDSNADSELDRAISFACGQFGHDWKLLFLQLGLRSNHLDDCDGERSIPLKCQRAFDKWKTMKGKSATIEKLLQGLCESERLGTAEELIDKLGLDGYKSVLEPYRQQDEPRSGTDSDNQSSYWSTSLRSLEAKQMTKSEDSEKYIQDAEKYVPSDKRHVQIIAVGQTGMGKTRTMNRTFGTMATEAVPGQGSVTDKVTTYTRAFQTDGGAAPFQLSFTDTPGLGDTKARFSDDDICKAIKKSIEPNAAVFILYFIKNGESKNQRHIDAIKKLETVTESQITSVVMTNATKMPDFGECSRLPVAETFRSLYKELELAWTPKTIFKSNKGLRRECEETTSSCERTLSIPRKGLLSECIEILEEEENVNEFDKQFNGDPWSDKTKKLVVKLYFRRKIRREWKDWFREHLGRPYLRVIKIENDTVEYGDEQGKFGLFQFHTKLGLVLNEKSYASWVFSLMTLDQVQAVTENLDISAIDVSSQTNDVILKILAPKDDSSKATRIARELSSRGILRFLRTQLLRLLNWLKSVIYRKLKPPSAQQTKTLSATETLSAQYTETSV
ncbi:uncharacterized protein [Oscarella lobularis]